MLSSVLLLSSVLRLCCRLCCCSRQSSDCVVVCVVVIVSPQTVLSSVLLQLHMYVKDGMRRELKDRYEFDNFMGRAWNRVQVRVSHLTQSLTLESQVTHLPSARQVSVDLIH